MKYLNLSFLLILTIFLSSCAGGSTEKAAADTLSPEKQMIAQQELWDEVMVVHDNIMPKMPVLEKIKEALKTSSESMTDEAVKQKMVEAITQLEKADKQMWDWMHNLKKLKELRKDKSHEEIMTYLNGLKESIAKVESDIKEAGRNAEITLKTNEK